MVVVTVVPRVVSIEPVVAMLLVPAEVIVMPLLVAVMVASRTIRKLGFVMSLSIARGPSVVQPVRAAVAIVVPVLVVVVALIVRSKGVW